MRHAVLKGKIYFMLLCREIPVCVFFPLLLLLSKRRSGLHRRPQEVLVAPVGGGGEGEDEEAAAADEEDLSAEEGTRGGINDAVVLVEPSERCRDGDFM